MDTFWGATFDVYLDLLIVFKTRLHIHEVGSPQLMWCLNYLSSWEDASHKQGYLEGYMSPQWPHVLCLQQK